MMDMKKWGIPIGLEFLKKTHPENITPKGDASKAVDSLWLSCEAGDAQRWLSDGLLIMPVA